MLSEGKKVCVIQLTRLGDILQTLQAIQLAQEVNPNNKYYLIARKSFAAPLGFLLSKSLANVIWIDTQDLVVQSKDISDYRKKIKNILAELNNYQFDEVVNLSFSKSSSYLCSLIKSKRRLGPYVLNHDIQVDDEWSRYIYSVALNGPLNTFPLVELYARILGRTSDINHKEKRKFNNKIIIHPFSSKKRKHWKANKWIEIIYRILKSNREIEVSLVGSKAEEADALTIQISPILDQFKGRVKNYVGKTNLESLYELVGQHGLFIGHDSMVGHMASLQNITTVTMALGSVRFEETTPFGVGNIVIHPKTKCYPCFTSTKCDYYQCHTDIPYQLVSDIVEIITSDSKLSEEDLINRLSRMSYRSADVLKSFKDEKSGFLRFIPLVEKEQNILQVLKSIYRICWLFFLWDKEEQTDVPMLEDGPRNYLENLLVPLRGLIDLGTFGKQYSISIAEISQKEEIDIDAISALSAKIDEIDKMMHGLRAAYNGLSSMVDYFNFEKSNLKGIGLFEVSKNSAFSYHEFTLFCSAFLDLLESTLERNGLHKEKEK